MAQAFEQYIQLVTLETAQDLSAHQYRALVFSGELVSGVGAVQKPLTAGAMVYGVQHNVPMWSRGETTVQLAVDGTAPALGDGTCTAGSRVAAAGTSGLFRKAQTGDWVRGIARSGDGGVSGGRFALELHHMGKEPA